MHILFVCSQNKWRSRTAETIFKDRLSVRSAGTERGARVRVTCDLLAWSEVIFVMEKKHRERLTATYPEVLIDKTIIVLDIPDEYTYLDAELIAHLEDVVAHHLNF